MKIRKNLKLMAIHTYLPLLIGAFLMALAPASRASVAAPYPVDADTLHLWHCDETTGNQIFDAVSNNLQTVPITMTAIYGKSNAPVGIPTQFATNNQPAALPFQLPQLGRSIQTTQYSGFYGPFTIATNADGTTNISPTGLTAQAGVYVSEDLTNINNYINPTTGAFTWEMLIQPSGNLLNPNHIQELFGWEGGNAPWARALQWRIYTSLSNGVSAARLYYQEVSSGNGNPSPDPGQNGTVWQAALPATGPDAVVPGQWYHVAMTFTGTAPTNGDTPNVLTMYWTAVSLANTNCHVLRTFSKTNNLVGMVFPNIGGYTRASLYNNVSGGNGFEGNIDEIRISSVCRKADEMFFAKGVQSYCPFFSVEPPGSKLVGYGQTLTLNAAVDASPAPTITWKQNGVVLPGQTNAILMISNVTFAANGTYQCFATNDSCGASSTVCAVTVGAAVDELFGTGMDDNGQPRGATAPGATDLHWFLVQNPDTATPYPYSVVWDASHLPNAYYADTPSACWIGPRLPPARVAGIYEYETHFLINQGDVDSVTITGGPFLMTGMPSGTTLQMFINGVETDFTANGGMNTPMAPFTLTKANGLVAGYNTLDLLVNCSSPGANAEVALMLGLSGVGQALPPGLAGISNQPPSQTVGFGSNVSMSVVAVGRPPLSYQWLSNGVPVPGAIKRTLSFVATNFGPSQVVGNLYTADYRVVISNDSGSVTSSVATLTVTIPPLTVASAGIPIWNSPANQTNIVVFFSDAVDPSTAAVAGNYSLDNGASVLSAVMGDAPNKVVLTTSVLNPATTYNLTVQNVKDWFGIIMPSPSSVLVGTYPATVALWLRADTGVTTNSDGTVSQWDDLSGNGNHLFGGAVQPQIADDPISGRPVVRFVGSNGTYMVANSAPSLALTGDMSILAVVSFAEAGGSTNGMIVAKVNGNNQPAPYDYYAWPNSVRLLRGNGSGSAVVGSTKAPSVGVQHLLDVTMKGTTVMHRLDGQPNGSGTLSTTIADTGHPLSIGVREDGVERLTGDMAELIIIGSALTASDVAAMENYLVKEHSLRFVNTSPTNIVLSVGAGNQLTFSWPADHIGWQLQSNSISLTATGAWFTVSGSTATNQMTITPDAAQSNVFYRLFYQP